MIERANSRAFKAAKWALAAGGLVLFFHGLNDEPGYESPRASSVSASWRGEVVGGLVLDWSAVVMGLGGMEAANRESRRVFSEALAARPSTANANRENQNALLGTPSEEPSVASPSELPQDSPKQRHLYVVPMAEVEAA